MKISCKPPGIALLSGGLDSTVSLAAALESLDVELLLFFNYGQRALQNERKAVMGIANYYGIPLRELEIAWLGELSPGGMRLGGKADLEDQHLFSLKSVWIPNRNGVFINIAAAMAEKYQCEYLITGFNREEAEDFPDNRREFVSRMNKCLCLSTQNSVKVVSFTQGLDKVRIIELGTRLSTPLSIIWSCYKEGDIMCGKCASCTKLKAACNALPQEVRPQIKFAA